MDSRYNVRCFRVTHRVQVQSGLHVSGQEMNTEILMIARVMCLERESETSPLITCFITFISRRLQQPRIDPDVCDVGSSSRLKCASRDEQTGRAAGQLGFEEVCIFSGCPTSELRRQGGK